MSTPTALMMGWRPEYSNGIEEIDAQHRELLSLFARISESISREESWVDTHYRIVELKDFAGFHFRFEEALLRLFGYPESALHAAMHQNFFHRLAEVEAASVQRDVKEDVLAFLTEWLTNHITSADRSYAAHILGGAKIVPSART